MPSVRMIRTARLTLCRSEQRISRIERIMKVFAIELNGCDGIYDVVYVAANDRDEAVNVLKASRQSLTWYDVIWLEGASYETDKPCEIKSRLCIEDGEII